MIDLYLLRNALRDLTRPRKLLAALFLVAAPSYLKARGKPKHPMALAEHACDDAALLATGRRAAYAQTLLDIAAAVRTMRGLSEQPSEGEGVVAHFRARRRGKIGSANCW